MIETVSDARHRVVQRASRVGIGAREARSILHLSDRIIEAFAESILHRAPRMIVETGTRCGLSAAFMAMLTEAEILTIDPNPDEQKAQDLWELCGVADRIRLHVGTVLDAPTPAPVEYALIDGAHSMRWAQRDTRFVRAHRAPTLTAYYDNINLMQPLERGLRAKYPDLHVIPRDDHKGNMAVWVENL